MPRNIALVEEHQHETSFCEKGSSSQNQVAIPAANSSVVRVPQSSSSEDWSTSDEDEGGNKQVAEIRPQAPTESKVQVNNVYTGCTGVSSTVNNTTVYKDGATVNNNYYCCSVPLDYVVKWCTLRRILVIPALALLGISLITVLCVCLSNLKISRQRNDITTETVPVVVVTERMPRRTTTVIPIILNDSTNCTTISTSTNSSHRNTSENSNKEFKIIKRKCWKAQQATSSPIVLDYLPPMYVIFSETETETCTTVQKCKEIVRNIQATQIKGGLDDIAYNFLIGGDGMVYEGRSWDVEGDHSEYSSVDYDGNSIDISFIGSFDIDETTEIQLQAAIALIKYGVQNKKLKADYKLKAHKQLTLIGDNPGDNLFSEITKWKGWDSETIRNFMIMGDYFL